MAGKKIKITIKTLTPFNINAGIQDGGFIDQIAVKDINNKPYIPASSIKGKIRDNYRLLNGEEKTKIIFGKGEWGCSSKIFVDNFYSIAEEPISSIRHGNSISRYRKIALYGALFVKETISGSFEGYIEMDSSISNEVLEDLKLSIKMIESIGGGKSRGLGKVKLTIEEVQ